MTLSHFHGTSENLTLKSWKRHIDHLPKKSPRFLSGNLCGYPKIKNKKKCES
jgi:hypothetical protein